MSQDLPMGPTKTATEHLVIVSKVKNFIKQQQGLNVSTHFFTKLDEDVLQAITEAVENTKKLGRKTVLGRDFNFFKEHPKFDEALVVASKIKRLIKDLGDLNTSAQVVEQLTMRVQRICLDAIAHAVNDKRKTVMDRDFMPPTIHTHKLEDEHVDTLNS